LKHVYALGNLMGRHFPVGSAAVGGGKTEQSEATLAFLQLLAGQLRQRIADQVRMQAGDAVEPSGREHQGPLVEHFVGRRVLVVGGEYDSLGVAADNEEGVHFIAIPMREGGAGPFEEVDLHAMQSQVVEESCENLLWRGRRVIGGIDHIHAENAYRFLLLDVGWIHEVDVQNDVAGLVAGLAEKAQSHPAVTVVGP
jgi:hypothetical protein